MKPIVKRSACPISYALDFFGDKWTLLILRDMLIAGKRSFGEFVASEEGIASNILTERLNMLVAEGFMTKQVDAEKRSRFRYLPTEKSIGLIPVLSELSLWSGQYNGGGGPQDLIAKLKSNRRRTEQALQKKLRKEIAVTAG